MTIEKDKYYTTKKAFKNSLLYDFNMHHVFYVDKEFWTTDYFYVIVRDVHGQKKYKTKILSIRKWLICNYKDNSICEIITMIDYCLEKDYSPYGGYEVYEISEQTLNYEIEANDNFLGIPTTKKYTYGKQLLTENLNYTRGIRKYITRKK
jgi:hypothetical protein